jgi:cell division protein FtsI/penicillin-binding protein 2
VQPFVPSIVRRDFINPANVALIQQGMHLGVTSAGYDPYWGTSYNVRDPRIDAAGKTGTAEVTDGPPHAWWIGYAPFKHPQVAVEVLVPNADSEGAAAAAPIAHKIFEDYFHLKPLKKDWLQDVTHLLVGTGTQ